VAVLITVDGDGSNNCCIIPEYYDIYRKFQKNLYAHGGFTPAASAHPNVIHPDRYSFIIISAAGEVWGDRHGPFRQCIRISYPVQRNSPEPKNPFKSLEYDTFTGLSYNFKNKRLILKAVPLLDRWSSCRFP
jgi:hypothetical protein